ncbi:MAG: hypothetical protein JW798_02115 [Prolixibacteraceae bacterium]|nr:hypothetical protein [Prolixibacteraceae bacterium]
MKKILLICLVLGFAFVSVSNAQPIYASTYGLNGYYEIGNWSQVPNSGTIDISGAPNSLTFLSGDSGFEDTTYISIYAPCDIIVKINWTYTTPDVAAHWDFPVYFINGEMFPFSTYDMDGALIQNGLEVFTVQSGQNFGIGAYTEDGFGGACTIDAVSFEFETVPVGITAALGVFGLAGISLFARRRMKRSKKEV